MDKSRGQLFDDIVGQLNARFGHSLPPLVARATVQSAWRAICGERDWFFLRKRGKILIPPTQENLIGTFTIGSGKVTDITGDTETYLNNIPFNLQHCLGIIGPDKRYYQILKWFPEEKILILSEPYYSSSQLFQTFRTVVAFIPAPYVKSYEELNQGVPSDFGAMRIDPTFTGWVGIEKGINSLVLKPNPREIDSSPELYITNSPQSIHPANPGTEQSPLYATDENSPKSDAPWFRIYPTYGGSELLVFTAKYRSSGGSFSDDPSNGVQVLPTVISSELLLSKASVMIGIWAQTNLTKETRINFLQIAASYEATYQALLGDAMNQDDSIAPKDRLGEDPIYDLSTGELILLDNRRVVIG